MADVTTRQVRGKWTIWDLDSNSTEAASGQVIFHPSSFIVIAEDNTVVASRPITVSLDSDGEIDVELPITDDDRYDPTPFHFYVEEHINGEVLRTYDLSIPEDAQPLDLSTEDIDADPPTPAANYLLANDSRVAPTPSTGTANQLIRISSGGEYELFTPTFHVGDADSPITDKSTARPDVPWGITWWTDFSGSGGGVPDNMEATDIQLRVDEAAA